MYVSIFSKAYLQREDDTWSARPSCSVFNRLIGRSDSESNRWIVDVNGTLIALGSPAVEEDHHSSKLFLPSWLVESSGLVGDGDEMEVSFLRSEELPKATSLHLRVLGEVPEGFDMRELLEEPLSSLGVLRAGQIIPAPVLDGIQILVEKIEPEAPAVFLDGNDVALHLESDVVTPKPPTPPIPSAPDDFNSVLSTPVVAVPAPAPSAFRRVAGGSSTPFVPFSGVGRRLCD
jgi:hypothetical protein